MAWNRLDHVPSGLRPAVRGGTVYLDGYTLEAVRIADSERTWSVKPHGDRNRERWGPVTVSGSRLYAAEGIYPRRLDPRDGSQLWSGYSESAGTALYAGRALPRGHAVWSIGKSVVQTEPMELDAAKAVDGGEAVAVRVPPYRLHPPRRRRQPRLSHARQHGRRPHHVLRNPSARTGPYSSPSGTRPIWTSGLPRFRDTNTPRPAGIGRGRTPPSRSPSAGSPANTTPWAPSSFIRCMNDS